MTLDQMRNDEKNRVARERLDTMPITEPFITIIHPVEAHDWIARGYPQSRVFVMEQVGGPLTPVAQWVKAHP